VAGVDARVLQRGLADEQLGGHLVHLGHRVLLGQFFFVLLPRDVSIGTRCAREERENVWDEPKVRDELLQKF